MQRAATNRWWAPRGGGFCPGLTAGLLLAGLLFLSRSLSPSAPPAATPAWPAASSAHAPSGSTLAATGGVQGGASAGGSSPFPPADLSPVVSALATIQADVKRLVQAAPDAAQAPCPPTTGDAPALRGAAAAPAPQDARPAPGNTVDLGPVPDNAVLPTMGGGRGHPLDHAVVLQSSQKDYKGERFIMFLLKDDMVSTAIMYSGWEVRGWRRQVLGPALNDRNACSA